MATKRHWWDKRATNGLSDYVLAGETDQKM